MRHIPATTLADFLALRAVKYVTHGSMPPTKGASCLFKALKRMRRHGHYQIVVPFTKQVYPQNEAEIFLQNTTRDIHTFCQRTGLKLVRAQALFPSPEMGYTTTGIVLHFEFPNMEHDRSFAA